MDIDGRGKQGNFIELSNGYCYYQTYYTNSYLSFIDVVFYISLCNIINVSYVPEGEEVCVTYYKKDLKNVRNYK